MRPVLLACLALAVCAAANPGPAPAPRPWGDRYRVILWCGDRVERNRAHTNALAAACRELGDRKSVV